MKRLISIVITIIVLLGINYAITFYTNAKFVDYSFIIGLATTIIIWFFTSKGGFTSKNVDMYVQATTGIKQEEQKLEFTPNIVFFTSIAYTVISFIWLLIYYRDSIFK